MVLRYSKIPVVVEALQWTGDNFAEIQNFCPECYWRDKLSHKLIIPTLEGHMEASLNDYIIKGIVGEYYPCKPDAFWRTYKLAE